MSVVALAAIAFASSPSARGDPEETEHRLKTAGVPDELRPRIHAAIARGVEWLVGRQRPDGSFRPDAGEDPSLARGAWMLGTDGGGGVVSFTALCSLALAHAGGAKATAAAERGVAFLARDAQHVRSEIYSDTYSAGTAVMLLRAVHGDAAIARDVARTLADSVGKPFAYWGPETRNAADRGGRSSTLPSSQFAVLGLWAADAMGAKTDPRVWTAHIASLVEAQAKDGSWGFAAPLSAAAAKEQVSGSGPSSQWPYPTGTAMGVADLVLARAAAGRALRGDPALDKSSADALERGLAALHRDGPRTLEILRGERRPAFPWHFCEFDPMHDLWTLERACVFAGIERLGGVAWYVAGAEALLDAQTKDGGFGGSTYRSRLDTSGPIEVLRPARNTSFQGWEDELVRTSYALLFLLRDAETLRAETPRDVDTPGPTTPSIATPKPPDPPPPAPAAPRPTPLDVALDVLSVLEAKLGDRAATNESIVEAIDAVARAYVTLAPTKPADEAAFRVAAEAALLRALVLERIDGATRANERTPVAVRAAQALARTRSRVSAEIRRVVEERWLKARTYDVSPDLWAATFDALAALGEVESAQWLIDEIVTADRRPERLEPTRAALEALRLFPRLPGRVRRDAARRLVVLFVAVDTEMAVRFAVDYQPWVTTNRWWNVVGPPTVRLLRRLCRARDVDDLPGREFPRWSGALENFRRWLDAHEDLGRAPWNG